MSPPPIREFPDRLGPARFEGTNTLLLGAPFIGKSTRLDAVGDESDDLAVVSSDRGADLGDARAVPGDRPVVVDDFYVAYRRADPEDREGFADWLDREAPVGLSVRPRDLDRLLDPDAGDDALDPGVLDRFEEVVALRYDPDRPADVDRAVRRCVEIGADPDSPAPDLDAAAVRERLDRIEYPGYEFASERLRATIPGGAYGPTLVPALVVYLPDFEEGSPDGDDPAHAFATARAVAAGRASGRELPATVTDRQGHIYERAVRSTDPAALETFYATYLERIATSGDHPPTWSAWLVSDLVDRTVHADDSLGESRPARVELVGSVTADVVHLAAWGDRIEGGLLDDAVAPIAGIEPADPGLFAAVVDRVAETLAAGTTSEWLRSSDRAGAADPDLSVAREEFLVRVYAGAVGAIASECDRDGALEREAVATRLDRLEGRVRAAGTDAAGYSIAGRVARRATVQAADGVEDGGVSAGPPGWLPHFLDWHLDGDATPRAVYGTWIDDLGSQGATVELVPRIARDALDRLVGGDDRLGETRERRVRVAADAVAAAVQAIWNREYDLDGEPFRAVVDHAHRVEGSDPGLVEDLANMVGAILEETHGNPLAAHEWEQAVG